MDGETRGTKPFEHCSVILLGCRRRANVEAIVDQQAEYPEVAEIVVAHCDPSRGLQFAHPKVQVIDFSTDPGLRARWIAGALAKSDALVFQDDDLLLPQESIRGFLRLLSEDSRRGYAVEGRNPDAYNRYVTKDVKGDVEIILTRAACVHRRIIPYLLSVEERLFTEAERFPSATAFPADDLLLSYCLWRYYARACRSVDLTVWELPPYYALSQRKGHRQKRTAIMRSFQRMFGSLTRPERSPQNGAGLRPEIERG